MLPANEKVRNIPEVAKARKAYAIASYESEYIESKMYNMIKNKEYYHRNTSRNTETVQNRLAYIEDQIKLLRMQHETAVDQCLKARENFDFEQKLALRNLETESK